MGSVGIVLRMRSIGPPHLGQYIRWYIFGLYSRAWDMLGVVQYSGYCMHNHTIISLNRFPSNWPYYELEVNERRSLMHGVSGILTFGDELIGVTDVRASGYSFAARTAAAHPRLAQVRQLPDSPPFMTFT